MKRRIRIMLATIRWWFAEYLPDDCEKCGGKNGGVRGNENIWRNEHGHDVLRCDYCGKPEENSP